jgi:hypothetical protein
MALLQKNKPKFKIKINNNKAHKDKINYQIPSIYKHGNAKMVLVSINEYL